MNLPMFRICAGTRILWSNLKDGTWEPHITDEELIFDEADYGKTFLYFRWMGTTFQASMLDVYGMWRLLHTETLERAIALDEGK